MNNDKAYSAAVRLLAAADNTAEGLSDKLISRGYTRQEAAYAVGRLIAEGSLDETSYAERVVEKLYKGLYGKAYIISYLKAKKFSPDSLSFAEAVMDALDFDATAKKYYGERMKKDNDKKKALAALYRRGFFEQ